MLSHLPALILLEVAILFTSLAWGLGFYVADRCAHIVLSLSPPAASSALSATAPESLAPPYGA